MSKSNLAVKIEEVGCPHCAALSTRSSELIKYFRKHVPPMPKVQFVAELHTMVDNLETVVVKQEIHEQ
jgi:hypothetical protein